MARVSKFSLVADKKGALWDLCLYVPIVIFLISIAIKLWYGGVNQNWSYVLLFMATFFFISGTNRVLSGRLMVLPSAPLALDVSKSSVKVLIKSGSQVELVKDLRYFPDYAGKSFGLTGVDLSGQKKQFVFHKGQFESESMFKDVRSLLSVYK